MITVTPSRDIATFNRLINHPDIAPHVRDDAVGAASMDVSSLNSYANVLLLVKSDGVPVGFAMMLARGSGVYEQHSGMLKSYRGHNALRAGRDVLRWMFLNTDCVTVSTWAWSSAKHVTFMARAIGFVEEARVRWPHTVNNEAVDRVIFSQTLAEWSRRAKDDYVEDSLRMNLGVEPQMIGIDAIFARMALAGHYEKAQNFYNRIAAVFTANAASVMLVRSGVVVALINNRVVEISPDLSASVVQSDSPCQSLPHSHT